MFGIECIVDSVALDNSIEPIDLCVAFIKQRLWRTSYIFVICFKIMGGEIWGFHGTEVKT